MNKFIAYIFILFSILGCSNSEKYAGILNQADKMIDSNPDSTLVLLDMIDSPESLPFPAKADYGYFCKTALYEQAMETEDTDNRTEIFCKVKDDCIVGMIILNRQNKSVQMVCLSGRFSSEDVKSALSGEGMQGIGLNSHN